MDTLKDHNYYVYILTNNNKTVLYTGVTNNLERKIYEHKNGINKGFTKKYNINNLVYYEIQNDINEAIKREKQIKAGSRKKKINLINSINPGWEDLAEKIFRYYFVPHAGLVMTHYKQRTLNEKTTHNYFCIIIYPSGLLAAQAKAYA